MIYNIELLDLFSHWDCHNEPVPHDELQEELGRLSLERGDFGGCIIFNDFNYQRILIHMGPAYEALVLCWRSGQRSPIHDHSGSACVIHVVEGSATETIFEPSPCGRLVPTHSHTAGAGSICASYDSDIHQLANLEPPGRDLITLHVYSPPLARMRLYSLDDTTLAHHDDMIALRPQTIVATVRTNGSQGRFDTALAQRSGKTP